MYGDLTVCNPSRSYVGSCDNDAENTIFTCVAQPNAFLSPCPIDDWCNAGTVGDASTDRCRLVEGIFSACTLYTTPGDYYTCTGVMSLGKCDCQSGGMEPA